MLLCTYNISALPLSPETSQKVQAPAFSKELKSETVPEGTQYVLECQVTGIPSPTISWFKEKECIDNNNEYVISKTNNVCQLKIRRAAKSHTATFTCKATNKGGEASSSCKLDVISKDILMIWFVCLGQASI